jgi:hypothetical protein
MARSRNIKPAIMDNEQLAEFEPATRLLFIYLWMLADREGRLEDRPKRIAAQALPYDTDLNVESMLSDLQSAGFIVRYQAGGLACIQITAFAKHQKPHVREAESTLPTLEQNATKAVTKHSHGSAKDNQGNAQHQPNGPETASNREHDLGSAKASPRSPDCGMRIPDSGLSDSHIACVSVGEAGLTAGEVCKAMKRANLGGVNPGSQTLKALLDAGATLDEFTGAAAKAVEGGKGFAYALGIVKRDREQAAAMAAKLHRGELPPAETTYQRSMRERMAEAAPAFARPPPGQVQTPHPSQAAEFFLGLARQKTALQLPTGAAQ